MINVKREIRLYTSLLILCLSAACTLDVKDSGEEPYRVTTPVETFTLDDQPQTVPLQTYNLITPWGYNKTANSSRTYPLVVSGMYTGASLYSEEVKKKYPSFYLDFTSAPSDELGVALADLIDSATQSGYRIEPQRIYLTGFSQGGSGSFKLARGMNTRNKQFAAILRFAGQSETLLPEKAAAQTSLWYHIGLDDTPTRVEVARQTYAQLKNNPLHAQALETKVTDGITGKVRTTWTLTKDGMEIVKLSEYEAMGHEYGPCYKDAKMIDWMFQQSLACRPQKY